MSEHTVSDRIIEEYLGDLRDALRTVNPSSSKEFVAEIEQHISEGRTSLEPGDEVGYVTCSSGSVRRQHSPTSSRKPSRRAPSAPWTSHPVVDHVRGFAFGFGWLVGPVRTLVL